jgi:heme oxygenase
VREGANNGNRFIAMKLGGALGLEDGRGLTHLDPYGERQREAWEAFKAGWDGLGLDAGERARVLEAGRDMFRAITAMHTGVSRECHVG